MAHLLFLNIFSIISSSDILELAEIIKFSQFVFLERNLLSFFNLFKRIVYGFFKKTRGKPFDCLIPVENTNLYFLWADRIGNSFFWIVRDFNQ